MCCNGLDAVREKENEKSNKNNLSTSFDIETFLVSKNKFTTIDFDTIVLKHKKKKELIKYSDNLFNEGKIFDSLHLSNYIVEKYPKDYYGYYNIGNCLMKIKKNNEALNYLNIAINISPANELLYLKKGITLYNLQKYEEAIETFNKGLFLNDKIILP